MICWSASTEKWKYGSISHRLLRSINNPTTDHYRSSALPYIHYHSSPSITLRHHSSSIVIGCRMVSFGVARQGGWFLDKRFIFLKLHVKFSTEFYLWRAHVRIIYLLHREVHQYSFHINPLVLLKLQRPLEKIEGTAKLFSLVGIPVFRIRFQICARNRGDRGTIVCWSDIPLWFDHV